MAQSDVEYDEQSGRILYVYNRICLKADCSFRKLKHQKTTRCLSMSAPQKKELQKQILLPSFLFSHFFFLSILRTQRHIWGGDNKNYPLKTFKSIKSYTKF